MKNTTTTTTKATANAKIMADVIARAKAAKSAPKVEIVKPTLESVKATFVACMQGHQNAHEKITVAFQACVPFLIVGEPKDSDFKQRKALRTTLLAWCKEAGLQEGHSGNVIGLLMKEADLSIRHRKGGDSKVSDAIMEAVAMVLEFTSIAFKDSDINVQTVLYAAARELKKPVVASEKAAA